MVFPMQVIELSINEDSCCEITNLDSGCCEKSDAKVCHTDNPKSDNSSDACKDHCQQCHTCHGCFMPIFNERKSAQLSNINFNNQENIFSHSNLFFNNRFFNIWQPPKIA